jgi:uncharacterized protein (DUF1499 family)
MSNIPQHRLSSMPWVALSAVLLLASCASKPPAAVGVSDGRFAPCPDDSNCVSSDTSNEKHRVEPFRLKAPPLDAWHGLQNELAAQRVKLIEVSDTYMLVQEESSILRFVDETEFNLRADEGLIAVRSAARTGIGTGSSNRERVERIRQALQSRGLVE